MSKFHILIFYSFRKMSRQSALRSGRARPGRFIVLNDSAGPKVVIKMYINIFRFIIFFLKVECRRGDPYMTATRNFVHFAHS